MAEIMHLTMFTPRGGGGVERRQEYPKELEIFENLE